MMSTSWKPTTESVSRDQAPPNSPISENTALAYLTCPKCVKLTNSEVIPGQAQRRNDATLLLRKVPSSTTQSPSSQHQRQAESLSTATHWAAPRDKTPQEVTAGDEPAFTLLKLPSHHDSGCDCADGQTLSAEAAADNERIKSLETRIERIVAANRQNEDNGKEIRSMLTSLERLFDEKNETDRNDGSRAKSLINDNKALQATVQQLQSSLSTETSEKHALLARQQADGDELGSVKSRVEALAAENARLKTTVEQQESATLAERHERQTYQHLYSALRKTIRVMVRIRPSAKNATGSPTRGWGVGPGHSTLKIHDSEETKAKQFRFDRVFQPQSTNPEIFDEVLMLVRTTATEGAHAVIMAYGATGTGKSYTLTGDDRASPRIPGLVHLAASRIFDIIPGESTVEAASVYIYQGQVLDLTLPKAKRELHVPKTEKAHIPDAKYQQARAAEELVALFHAAERNTVTATTLMNESSSRGHTFFMVRITTPTSNPNQPCEGLLTFIDLAGNENVKESGAQGKQFDEARSINNDLLNLSLVIQNLRDGKKADTKRSKLTQLFAGAAGLGSDGAARHDVLLLAMVDLSPGRIKSGVRTLEFAQTVKTVR